MIKIQRKDSIKYNAVLNMIKQMCSVIFPFITIPYVTRVLQAENLGKVNFSTSVISYFLLIAQMGISNYAIREGAKVRCDKDKLNKLANEVFTLNIVSTIISYLMLTLAILLFKPLQNYKLLLIIQSVTIFCTTVGADWVNNIFEDFRIITIRTIIMQMASLLLMFIFVHNKDDYIVYTITIVLSQCGALIINSITIRKYVHLKLRFSKHLLIHIKPIFFLFFNNVAMTIYINSDTTMLGFIVGDSAVGIYYIAAKIYNVIKNIINAIIIVALPRLSACVDRDKQLYYKLCGEIFHSVITILFPAAIGLFCCSHTILKIVADKEFIDGALPLQILSVSLLFAVIGGFNTLCVVLPNRKEKILLLATSIAAVVNIGMNFLFIRIWSFNGAALTTVIAEAIVALITFVSTREFFRFKISVRIVSSVGIGCIFIGLICSTALKCISNIYISLFVSVVLSVLVYGMILFYFRNPLLTSIISKYVR